MLLIQKLARPNKHSGYALEPGKTTIVRGLTVVNGTKQTIFIDKYTRKKQKPKKRKIK